MADYIGIDRRNIARQIKKLQDKGIISRIGPDKEDIGKYFFTNPKSVVRCLKKL